MIKITGEEEGVNNLSAKTKDLERARDSLIEELEAINRYMERIEATRDMELRKLLAHNMDEEKEHVAMLVEYIRKSDRKQDSMFKKHD